MLTNLGNEIYTNQRSPRSNDMAPSYSSNLLSVFNMNALPPEVRIRYETHKTKKLMRGSDMKPFPTDIPFNNQPTQTREQYYYLDPPVTGHRLITIDGTLFNLRTDLGPKNDELFIKGAPRCLGNTAEDIRTWYMTFTRYAAEKGKYVHPYFCFRKGNVASTYGFSAGNDSDHVQHDLPRKYEPALETWSGQIYRAISAKHVFPEGKCDEQIQTIKNAGGHTNGYAVLRDLIDYEHPVYATYPSILIRKPRQMKTEELGVYFYRYQDYLQLRAFIENNVEDLNYNSEMDKFIDGTLYGPEYF